MPFRIARAAALLAAPLLLALALAAAPLPARAETVAPSKFVADLVAHAVAVLHDGDPSPAGRRERFRALIDGSFDLPVIAQFVLGRHWRAATDGERRQFGVAFTDYMAATYAASIADYGRAFTVTGERAAGPDIVIVSTAAAQSDGNPPLAIDWRAVREPDGYRITDVTIAGVSLMETKRAEMTAVIARSGGGITGLIAVLRDKTAAPQTATP